MRDGIQDSVGNGGLGCSRLLQETTKGHPCGSSHPDFILTTALQLPSFGYRPPEVENVGHMGILLQYTRSHIPST